MSSYNALPNSLDSPTDINADDELDINVDGYHPADGLLSPLDPHPLTRGLNRETAGHEFFSAVYLDSPLHPAEKEELEEAMFGGTRPLRVKKKVPGTRIAGLGPAGKCACLSDQRLCPPSFRALFLRARQLTPARHRRSNVSSVPQSPRSPTFSRGHDSVLVAGTAAPAPTASALARSNTTSSTTSTLHPHHSISRIFLEGSPIPASPPPAIPGKSHARASQVTNAGPDARATAYSALSLSGPSGASRPARPIRSHTPRSAKLSIRSDLHLNLGSVHTYDDCAQPGPSPPSSVATTPTPSLHSFDTSEPPPLPPHDRRNARGGRAYPLSPLTPSRVPAKAARLLGATVGTPPVGVPSRHGKKKDHFRPLPSETLVEIERFFGTVPPKPSKKSKPSTPPSSGNAKLSRKAHISGPIHLGGDGLGDRNVGRGGTVRHQGEDGSMWLDVEEEQEFAWLMSETYTRPSIALNAARAGKATTGPGHAGSSSTSSQISKDTDAAWGMETFTSVLSLPKGKRGKTGQAKAQYGFGESFFDFGDEDDRLGAEPAKGSKSNKAAKRPRNASRLVVPTKTIPCSSSTEPLQVVTPTKAATTPSAHIRAVSSSAAPDSDDAYNSTSPRADSPPRLKNRPPPLRLAPVVVNPRLPVISTTPGSSTVHHSQVQADARVKIRVGANAPVTPFVRPRRAPVPAGAAPNPVEPPPSMPATRKTSAQAQKPSISFPAPPSQSTRAVPAPVPPPPIAIAIPQLPPMPPYRPRGTLPVLGNDGRYDEEPMEISFFELDSPTDEKPAVRRNARGVMAAADPQLGRGGWLRKVVKPLTGAGLRA